MGGKGFLYSCPSVCPSVSNDNFLYGSMYGFFLELRRARARAAAHANFEIFKFIARRPHNFPIKH